MNKPPEIPKEILIGLAAFLGVGFLGFLMYQSQKESDKKEQEKTADAAKEEFIKSFEQERDSLSQEAINALKNRALVYAKRIRSETGKGDGWGAAVFILSRVPENIYNVARDIRKEIKENTGLGLDLVFQSYKTLYQNDMDDDLRAVFSDAQVNYFYAIIRGEDSFIEDYNPVLLFGVEPQKTQAIYF
jgi:hypothetical protein